MWIRRKYYRFLKENAEKNINMECQILAMKENEKRAVARAMEEYSATLKERDELRLKVIELEHTVEQLTQHNNSKCEHDWVYIGCDEYRCSKCGERKYR